MSACVGLILPRATSVFAVSISGYTRALNSNYLFLCLAPPLDC